ncbi:MAG: hypothetical protein H7834_04180 [Magnetococcus sp. YQC-9]
MGSKGEAFGTLFLTLVRSSKEAFFAPFAKNALRAALQKTTHPKAGAVYQSSETAKLVAV